MIRKKILTSVVASLLLALTACSEKAPAKTDDESGLSSSGIDVSSSDQGNGEDTLTQAELLVKRMGLGMNLGNALEAPAEGTWGVTLDAEYFKLIADSGFKHVRIPARWDTHIDSTSGVCVIDPVWMGRVRWAVDEAVKNGLIVVLDQHHYAAMYATPAAETQCFLEIWTAIATEMKSVSKDSLILELLNEPQSLLKAADWNPIAASAISTIRAIDPERTLMVGGDSWNSIDGLSGLKLPETDRNIIATFHFYEPYNFTHQGADWGDAPPPVGATWSAKTTEKAAIRAAFAKAANWSKQNDRPIYAGEFGSYSMADSVSREIWTEFVASEARRLNIAAAYWEFCSGFGVYDAASKTWKQYLMNALLHPTRGFDEEIKRPKLDTVDFVLLDDFDGQAGEIANVNQISSKLMVKGGGIVDSAPGCWYAYHNADSRFFTIAGDTLLTGDLIRFDSVRFAGAKDKHYQLITDGGHTGKALYSKIHLMGDSYPYVGVGTGVHSSATEYDFGKMVALSFWAKGKGGFKVAWVSAFTDSCCEDTWGKFGKEFTLTSEWTEYIVWADELVPSPYSGLETAGYEWKDHHLASQLQFVNSQSYGQIVDEELELYLDDVRFYGMTNADFGL